MATPVKTINPVNTSIAYPAPIYVPSPYQVACANLAVDAAAILIPETDIATGTRNILTGLVGSYLICCLKTLLADANGSTGTFVAFGRDNVNDPWAPLATIDASANIALATATASNVKDATYRYTFAANAKWFIRAGYKEVVFGVTSAYNGASVATASLLVREA